jgi:uncharacterized protein (TIGR02266 family)
MLDFVRGRVVSEAHQPEPGAGDGAERRRFARVNVELVVALSYPTMGDVIQCKTLDISEGGVFIATRRVRPEGTKVKLALEIGEHTLELSGIVVRVVEPGSGGASGMGVLFKDVRPGAKMLLSSLVAKNIATYESVKTPPRKHRRTR